MHYRLQHTYKTNCTSSNEPCFQWDITITKILILYWFNITRHSRNQLKNLTFKKPVENPTFKKPVENWHSRNQLKTRHSRNQLKTRHSRKVALVCAHLRHVKNRILRTLSFKYKYTKNHFGNDCVLSLIATGSLNKSYFTGFIKVYIPWQLM